MPHHRALSLLKNVLIVSLATLGVACAPKRPSDQARLEASEPQERAQRPVAIVRQEPVSAARLDAYIQAMPAAARARYASTERKQELLKSIVSFEAMADDAELRRLDQTPQGRALVLHEMKDMLARRALEARLRERRAQEVTREALTAAYDRLYPPPAEGAVSRPVYALKALGPELPRALREQVLAVEPGVARLNKLRTFAAQYSQDAASKQIGGALGVWRSDQALKDAAREPLRVAAMRLKPDEVSEPVEADGAWWLLMVGADAPATRPPLEQVERDVREAVLKSQRQETRRALLDELRENASITRDEAAIAAIKDTPAGDAP